MEDTTMDVQPIKTERDYEATLKQIDALMDARPDTARGIGWRCW